MPEKNAVKTIGDFGYKFVDGKLQNIETGGPFRYNWTAENSQQRYEEFAAAITETVYELLENEAGLQRINIPKKISAIIPPDPVDVAFKLASSEGEGIYHSSTKPRTGERILIVVDAEAEEPRSFFFASPDAWTKEKLLILINGSGLVRAGQWSRKLIINKGLYEGSMLPYIQEGRKQGYAVLVMNTNENKIMDKLGVNQYIRDSEDPPAHALYVWNQFVSKAKAKRIAIVAHSAGGYTTVRLADSVTEDFVNRVFAVCFTDSAHVAGKSGGWEHLKKVTRNWTLSTKSLDTQLSPHRSPIRQVSAGTTKHDDTAHLAFRSVFRYFKEKEEGLSA